GWGGQIQPGSAMALRSSITETYGNNPTSHIPSIQATTLQVIGDKTTFCWPDTYKTSTRETPELL
ncbi:hypothetical protein, partial [Pseudomonas syringae]|uniref:hypothetical protein n=1 Tax=Pseudomonas syringae TaxID=317 RepID=UPI00195C9F77